MENVEKMSLLPELGQSLTLTQEELMKMDLYKVGFYQNVLVYSLNCLRLILLKLLSCCHHIGFT